MTDPQFNALTINVCFLRCNAFNTVTTIARHYFIGQSKVLESLYKASRTVHPADTGTNRENISAEWLVQHLPKSVFPEVGGNIIDSTGHVTKQIDIVLYNDSAPRFGSNLKSYFYAEGVVAAIEVKSKLAASELISAINNLETVKQCKIKQLTSFTLGTPSESILTGIFAFELGFASIQNLIKSLKRQEHQGKKPVDFVCINQKSYIAYNREVKDSRKGIWYNDNNGKKNPLPLGYIEVDTSQECVFRMVLTLSTEVKKNIATAIDFQSYFIKEWNVS